MVGVPDSDRQGAPLDAVTGLARGAFEPLSPAQNEQAFATTLARLAAQKGQARRRWQVLAVAAAAALLLVVGALTSRFVADPKPLALNLDGAELRQDGVVQALPEVKPALRFSDGTRIDLGESASLRVRSIDARGARIAVEQGEIRADVVHAPLAAWVFEAGPFAVEVKGTTFVLAWNSAEGRLDLRLERGLLAIQAPFSSKPISLQGGQRLVATARDQRFVVSSLSAPVLESDAVDRAGAAALAGAPPVAAPAESAASASPSGKPATRSGWAERFAAGDFRAIAQDAEAQGLDATLAQRGLEELGLLADAARYVGKPALARRALLAQRERFGRSSRAIDAAFMLGRLQEPTDPAEAVRWYDRYLSDAAAGSYAAEALGRKMLLIERLRGAAPARTIAEEYLRKHPQGPHAKSAERLVSQVKARP